MIIERLDLKAFGRFTDFSLDFSAGPHRLHIVYGPNESGKSTSLRAIKSLLYGMPNRTLDNYLHQNSKMRVGGLVTDETHRVDCVRRRGRKDTLRDAADDQPIDESVLHRMLGGVDRETFEQRFGLSHDELVRGGAEVVAGGGDLGSILFAASGGVSRLHKIESQIEKLCCELFIPRGKNASINKAITAIGEQKKALREAQVLPDDFQQRRDRLKHKQDEAVRLGEEVKEVAADGARLRSLQKALPLIPKWKSTRSLLDQLAATPSLDAAFTERRRRVDTEREVAIRQQAELRKRLGNLRQELETSSDQSVILENETQIQQLFERLGARIDAKSDQAGLIRKRDNMNRRMIELLNDLQVKVIADDDSEVGQAVDHVIGKMHVGDSVQVRVHELARKHERLIQQRDDAAEELHEVQQRVGTLQQELGEFDSSADPEAMNQLIDSISHPDALLDSLTEQASDVDRAKRACESIHRRLVGIDMTISNVAKLRLPSASAIQQAIREMQSADDALVVARAKHDQVVSERDQLRRRLKASSSGQPLPTLTELEQVRWERDELLNQTDFSGAEQQHRLRQAIQKADQVVDMIRLHHEKVHQRSLDLATLQTLDEEIVASESQLLSLEGDSQTSRGLWAKMWDAIGVQAETPERMHQWIADHEQLIQRVDQWNEARRRKQEIDQRIVQTSERLRAAIQSASIATATVGADSHSSDTLFAQEDSQIKLRDLYADAVAVRRKLNEDKARRRELESRLAELKQQLPESQSRLQTRQKQVDAWNAEWTTATECFVQTTDATPTVVVGMLKTIESLAHQKRERDILSLRVRSIGDDDLDFREEVKGLAGEIQLDFDERKDVNRFVRDLFQCLQNERARIAEQEALRKQVQQTEAECADAEKHQTQCEVSLQQLCVEARCNDIGELAEIERQSRERRELQASLDSLDEQLLILSGGKPVDEFIAQAEGQELGVLDVLIEQSESKLEELQDQLVQTQRDVGALRNELEQIDGGRIAADLSQSMQVLAGGLVRDAEEYARLKIASMILRRSIEHYRNENQGPVLEHARRLFRQLTCGEYQDLRVDCDATGKLTLFGVLAGASDMALETVPASAMSTGTADSLYLSLRLASLRHHLSQGTQIPLIVDDCLVQLDDARAIAALSAFSDLSTQTQIILFTHHRHLVDLASAHLSAEQFHTHQLSC